MRIEKCEIGIDIDDIAQKHVRAINESSIGWGRSTKESIRRVESGVHWSKSGNRNGSGNGIAMKMPPVGAFISSLWISFARNYENNLVPVMNLWMSQCREPKFFPSI